jgi:hypothetical protein
MMYVNMLWLLFSLPDHAYQQEYQTISLCFDLPINQLPLVASPEKVEWLGAALKIFKSYLG